MFLAPPFPFGSVIERNNLRGDLLTLAQAKEIHEIRKRFGVIGAYTTGKNYVLKASAPTAVQRHLCQAQHIKNIGVAHLIADGKGDHIKISNGILAFQCPQRQVIADHRLLHIGPGGKHTLAPNAVHLIHNAVEDPHTHVGHTDLVGIREAKRYTDTDILQVLSNLVIFTTGVSGRFLHRGKNSLKLVGHSNPSLM